MLTAAISGGNPSSLFLKVLLHIPVCRQYVGLPLHPCEIVNRFEVSALLCRCNQPWQEFRISERGIFSNEASHLGNIRLSPVFAGL